MDNDQWNVIDNIFKSVTEKKVWKFGDVNIVSINTEIVRRLRIIELDTVLEQESSRTEVFWCDCDLGVGGIKINKSEISV